MVAVDLTLHDVNGYFFLYEHMGSFDRLSPFLLILAAVELTVVVSADCLAGFSVLWVILSCEIFAPC